MKDTYRELFKVTKVKTPAYLLSRIEVKIKEERARAARARVYAASAGGFASLVGCLYGIRLAWSAAVASGFTAYASLLFSDSGLVWSNISSYTLSLLESFPTGETLVCVTLLAVLGFSLRAIAQGITNLERNSFALVA